MTNDDKVALAAVTTGLVLYAATYDFRYLVLACAIGLIFNNAKAALCAPPPPARNELINA